MEVFLWTVVAFFVGCVLGAAVAVSPDTVVHVGGGKGSVQTVNYKEVVYVLSPLKSEETK